MRKKYELTDETVIVDGVTLYRIRALPSLGYIRGGILGGFIQSEDNLSHSGNCWIFDEVCVYGNACVSGGAYLRGNVRVSGNAVIRGNAWVYGNVRVSGNTKWSLHFRNNPDESFFDSGVFVKDAVIETHKDFVREFPEWCI